MGLEPQPIETRGRTHTSGSDKRQAAIHTADHVIGRHPNNRPAARDELRLLLDVLGITTDQNQHRGTE